MSNPYWIGGAGGAAQVAQVITLTPGGTIESGDKFIVTLEKQDGSTEVESVNATGTTVAQVCTDIYNQLSVSTKAEFAAITWSNQTTHVRGTAETAGVPIKVTATTTESNDAAADAQTFTAATTTPNVGFRDWGTALNWSTGAVPVTSDTVTLDGRGNAYDILHGLWQSAVTLAALNIDYSFIKAVGTNSAALRISATAIRIGRPASDGSGSGSACINIDAGTAQYTLDMQGSRNTGTSGQPPVQIKGSHAANAIYQSGGILGVATAVPGQTATVLTAALSGGTLTLGDGVTGGTVTNNGGIVHTNGAITALVNNAGQCFTDGTGLIGTMTGNGGQIECSHRVNASPSIGTLNLRGASIDYSKDQRAITVTTMNFRKGTIKTFSPSQLTVTTMVLDQDVATQFTLGVQ